MERRSLLTRVCLSGLLLLGSTLAQTGPCATVIPGNPLPDLIVDPVRLSQDLMVTVETFASDSCAVVEGCVSSKGRHTLLRFTTSFANVGAGDLFIGDPASCLDLYHLSPCHNHYHLEQAADYRIWTEQGYQTWAQGRNAAASTASPTNSFLLTNAAKLRDLVSGHKQGFCYIDSVPYQSLANPTRKYTLCGSPGAPGYQGIQKGWADVYGSYLDGQWVEIDRLRDGIYVLEVQTNPAHVLPESNFANNYAALRIRYTAPRGQTPGSVTVLGGL